MGAGDAALGIIFQLCSTLCGTLGKQMIRKSGLIEMELAQEKAAKDRKREEDEDSHDDRESAEGLLGTGGLASEEDPPVGDADGLGIEDSRGTAVGAGAVVKHLEGSHAAADPGDITITVDE